MVDNIFFTTVMEKPVWMWGSFLLFVFFLLVLDLGVFHKKSKEIEVRESLLLSGFYILISVLYGCWVWFELGKESGLEFFTAFVIEKSLSVDNLFVMAVIFSALKIPRQYQHRVLFWGILGVIVMRGLMIGAGAALVHQFEWVLYLFGAFLIFTGVKLFFWDDDDEHEESVQESKLLKFLKKTFHVTDECHEEKFIVRLPSSGQSKSYAWHITPLLLALMMIEVADVIFAVDSVPAVFAITTDTFVVYTSNIFAILGLRALYFSLSALMERFVYLKYSICAVLVFIGAKVFVPLLADIDKVPAEVSLSVTVGLLAVGMIYSLFKTRKQ